MTSAFLNIKKLKEADIVAVAARHNLREIQAEIGASSESGIDPARICKNVILRGPVTAIEVANLAKDLMAEAGVGRLRSDAVRALEILFGWPPSSELEPGAFFDDAVDWAEHFFGGPVLSAVVHNDEGSPHCHVLMLPLRDGRMIGSDFVGNKARLRAIQADFQLQVGERYGMVPKPRKTRLSAVRRLAASHSAINALKTHHGLLIGPQIEAALLKLIAADPEDLLSELQITLPNARPKGGHAKTFVAQMTRPVKPARAELNPIGFAHSGTAEKANPTTV